MTGLIVGIIVVAVVVALILIILATSIRVVSQANFCVIERLGNYTKT